jgi:hypothetical protein
MFTGIDLIHAVVEHVPHSLVSHGVAEDPSLSTSPTLTVRPTLSPPRKQRDRHTRTWSLSARRSFSKHASRPSLFVPSYTGLAEEIPTDNLLLSDDEIFESGDEESNDWWHRPISEDDQTKQYGVLKMETIARTWGRRELMILYGG